MRRSTGRSKPKVVYAADPGKRSYMEDCLRVELSSDLGFVGVFDGHGGKEAASYVRDRLWDVIRAKENLFSTDYRLVKNAIVDSFLGLNREMHPLRGM